MNWGAGGGGGAFGLVNGVLQGGAWGLLALTRCKGGGGGQGARWGKSAPKPTRCVILVKLFVMQ